MLFAELPTLEIIDYEENREKFVRFTHCDSTSQSVYFKKDIRDEWAGSYSKALDGRQYVYAPEVTLTTEAG
jgi:hypothetical protein